MKNQKLTLTLLFCMLCLCFSMSVSAATKYTVKFVDTFDGKETVLSTQSVEKNKAATAPSNIPSHKGFAFSKWSTKYNKITKNLTVKAVYKQTHTLVYFVDSSTDTTKNIFYLNGKKQSIKGKFLTKEPKYFEMNAKVVASDFPNLSEKTGYTLKYWTGLKVGQIIKKPQILVAKPNYVANSYTIIFDEGDGGTGKMTNKKVTYGKTITLPANTFKKTGYTFSHWVGSDGKTYTNKQKVSNLTSEKNGTFTLNAQWMPIPVYKIAYDSDETTAPEVSVLTYGSNNGYRNYKIEPYPYSYHEEIHHTTAINSETGETTTYYWVERVNDPDTEDVVYKNNIQDEKHRYRVIGYGYSNAVLKDIKNVKYQNNPSEFTENNAFTVKNPTRMLYTFDKWKDEETGKTYKTYKITKGTSKDKKLIALWTPKKYTVTVKYGRFTKKFTTDITHGQENLFNTIFSKEQKPNYCFYTSKGYAYIYDSTIFDLLIENCVNNKDQKSFTINIEGIK